jgi:hypothetical protein
MSCKAFATSVFVGAWLVVAGDWLVVAGDWLVCFLVFPLLEDFLELALGIVCTTRATVAVFKDLIYIFSI